jgi:hypothetical protein
MIDIDKGYMQGTNGNNALTFAWRHIGLGNVA